MNTTEDNLTLFQQIAKGDKAAFDVFFERYYPRLVQFARLFVASDQAAEDVVADVLVNMLIHRKRVFTLAHFEAYLYASVKKKALSAIKKQERINHYPHDLPQGEQLTDQSADPHELLIEQELNSLTQDVIQNLPPKRKMVFQFIKEDGLSYRQVAELMDISERTVEVHLKLAIKTLRQSVEQYLGQKEIKKAAQSLVKNVSPLLLFYLSF